MDAQISIPFFLLAGSLDLRKKKREKVNTINVNESEGSSNSTSINKKGS